MRIETLYLFGFLIPGFPEDMGKYRYIKKLTEPLELYVIGCYNNKDNIIK